MSPTLLSLLTVIGPVVVTAIYHWAFHTGGASSPAPPAVAGIPATPALPASHPVLSQLEGLLPGLAKVAQGQAAGTPLANYPALMEAVQAVQAVQQLLSALPQVSAGPTVPPAGK